MGDGAQQGAGVGMLGVVENVIDGGLLDHPSQVHHGDVIAHLRHHTQVVGDEDDRHVDAGLQIAHQVQDLGFGGHIQGGGRLIGEQDGGGAGKRQGDHRPLAHATAQLVRVALDHQLADWPSQHHPGW